MALELIKENSLYTSAFAEFIKTRGHEPVWLRLLRQKSFARFAAAGFPTVKDEDWKYTNTAPIAKADFAPAVRTQTAASVDELRYPETLDSTVVFRNGLYDAELSSLQALSPAKLLSFADALASSEYEPLVRSHFERDAADNQDGFSALNAAFAEGVLIIVPENAKIEAPIYLMFATESGQAQPAAFPRVLIVAGENSSATVIESYTAPKAAKYLTNSVIDFVLDGGAHLHHYKIQRESAEAFHIGSTTADVGANATYDTTTINFGAAISRHGIAVRMDHEGAHCSVDGLYMVDGNQHTDTHSVIDHRQPRCSSHQLYKGILDGKSRAVFNGKVFVRHGAQQTDAKQTNKNLLLSPEARVDTKPQLEIFADDVKCAHGAAVGQLDQDELFYLESRGINPNLARNMLTYGFAEEVIEKIKIDSIKRELDEAVLNRLHAILEVS